MRDLLFKASGWTIVESDHDVVPINRFALLVVKEAESAVPYHGTGSEPLFNILVWQVGEGFLLLGVREAIVRVSLVHHEPRRWKLVPVRLCLRNPQLRQDLFRDLIKVSRVTVDVFLLSSVSPPTATATAAAGGGVLTTRFWGRRFP